MTKHELGPLPEKDYLGDDASYGYDACSMHAYALAEVERAVMAERERCALLCEQTDEDGEGPDCWGWHAKDYAKAIRAQSAPKEQA